MLFRSLGHRGHRATGNDDLEQHPAQRQGARVRPAGLASICRSHVAQTAVCRPCAKTGQGVLALNRLGAMQLQHRLARSIVAIDNFFVPTPSGRCIISPLQQFKEAPMSAPEITFEKFRDDMLAAGYEEVLERP